MSRPNHQRKLARAHDHLQAIERQIGQWREAKPYLTSHEYDLKKRWYVVYVETVDMSALDDLPVQIGDCLHDLRSGLDHVAFELAEAYSFPLTDDMIQDSEFPIFGDKDRKGNTGRGPELFKNSTRKIAGIHPKAQALIETLQPYQRGNAYETHPLWVLYDLARVDRHRLLHIGTADTSGGTVFTPHTSRNLTGLGPGVLHIYGGLVEGRTQLIETGVFPIDPSREVYVDVEPVMDIAFGKGTPAAEAQSVIETLTGIYTYVVNDVVLPLAAFL